MKLEKAFETLSKHGITDDSATWQDYLDAVKLGCEALKRILACREPEGGSPLPPLPSETPE